MRMEKKKWYRVLLPSLYLINGIDALLMFVTKNAGKNETTTTHCSDLYNSLHLYAKQD